MELDPNSFRNQSSEILSSKTLNSPSAKVQIFLPFWIQLRIEVKLGPLLITGWNLWVEKIVEIHFYHKKELHKDLLK